MPVMFSYLVIVDGRTLSVPLIWFPSLSSATAAQLKDWEILGDGEGEVKLSVRT